MGTSHGAAGRRPAYLIGRRAGPWERPLALSPTSPGPGVTRCGLDTAGHSCLAEPLQAPRPFPFSRVTWEPATGRRGCVAAGWCPGLPAHPAGPRPPPCSFPQTHWTDSAFRLAASPPHFMTPDAWGPPSLAPLLFSLPDPRPPPRASLAREGERQRRRLQGPVPSSACGFCTPSLMNPSRAGRHGAPNWESGGSGYQGPRGAGHPISGPSPSPACLEL